jgi:hypothetical protein
LNLPGVALLIAFEQPFEGFIGAQTIAQSFQTAVGQIRVGGALAGSSSNVPAQVRNGGTHSEVERRHCDGKSTIPRISGNDRKGHQPGTLFKR